MITNRILAKECPKPEVQFYIQFTHTPNLPDLARYTEDESRFAGCATDDVHHPPALA